MAAVGGATRVSPGELRAMLALFRVPGLGPARIRALVDGHGSAAAALRAARIGALESSVDRLDRVRPVSAAELEAARPAGTRLVAYGQPDYPAGLIRLHHPPPLLWLRGPRDPGRGRAVAIVGTRRATEYGRRTAGALAAGLARAGITVVSGLAVGIDAAAHRGALEAGGATVAVLGSGLDHEYPRANRPLFRSLRERGCLVSEFEPAVAPAPHCFPRRNRIIAALGEAVIVVQAGRRSGALITASQALEIGVDVMAVPGRVDVAASAGVHALLRDGAAPVCGAEDVLHLLGWETAPGSAAPGKRRSTPGREAASGVATPDRARPAGTTDSGSAPAARLRALVEAGPAGADELARGAGIPIGEALSLLTRWELGGAVRALPGLRFGPRTAAGRDT